MKDSSQMDDAIIEKWAGKCLKTLGRNMSSKKDECTNTSNEG